MSGQDDLRSKLVALAGSDGAYIGGARVISQGGSPSPLQAVLTEINDTVLTRDLTFRFGDAGAMVLVVSGRRLLGVRDIDRLAMPAVVTQLAGQQIKGEDDPHLRALIGVLLPLDLLGETITTTSSTVEWSGPETGTGVSVEKLAGRLSIEFPIKPVTRMSLFKSRLGSGAMASVQRLSTGEEDTEGGSADLDWLYANAASFLNKARPDTAEAKLAILGQSAAEGRTICAVFEGNESLLWVQNTADVAPVCALWNNIFSA